MTQSSAGESFGPTGTSLTGGISQVAGFSLKALVAQLELAVSSGIQSDTLQARANCEQVLVWETPKDGTSDWTWGTERVCWQDVKWASWIFHWPSSEEPSLSAQVLLHFYPGEVFEVRGCIPGQPWMN